jgi:hypothetical protein
MTADNFNDNWEDDLADDFDPGLEEFTPPTEEELEESEEEAGLTEMQKYDRDMLKQARREKPITRNSILGRRQTQRHVTPLVKLAKTCYKCEEERHVNIRDKTVEYRIKGTTKYVRLCMKHAKLMKDKLAYNKWYALAKE